MVLIIHIRNVLQLCLGRTLVGVFFVSSCGSITDVTEFEHRLNSCSVADSDIHGLPFFGVLVHIPIDNRGSDGVPTYSVEHALAAVIRSRRKSNLLDTGGSRSGDW